MVSYLMYCYVLDTSCQTNTFVKQDTIGGGVGLLDAGVGGT